MEQPERTILTVSLPLVKDVVKVMMTHCLDLQSIGRFGRTRSECQQCYRDAIAEDSLKEKKSSHLSTLLMADHNYNKCTQSLIFYANSYENAVKKYAVDEYKQAEKMLSALWRYGAKKRDEQLAKILGYSNPSSIETCKKQIYAGLLMTKNSIINAFKVFLESGEVQLAEQMAIRNSSVLRDFCDENGSALHYVLRYNAMQVLKILVDQGFDSNAVDKTGKTILFCAVGNKDIFQLLLSSKHCQQKNKDKFLEYLLQTNTVNDRHEYMKLLLEHGANIRSVDIGVLCNSGYCDVVKSLLNEGVVDVNAICGADRATLLQFACARDNADMVNFLLQKNASVDAAHYGNSALYDYYMTPLMFAAHNGNTEIAKSLLDYGADINNNCYGTTAFYCAYKNNKIDMMKFLLDNGANINDFNLQLDDIQEDNRQCLQFLCDNHCDFNKLTRSGTTLLHAVSNTEHIEKMQLLLENKYVDINVKNKFGQTPLVAILDQQIWPKHTYDLVEILLSGGADYNVTDCWGNHCLDLLISRNEFYPLVIKYISPKDRCFYRIKKWAPYVARGLLLALLAYLTTNLIFPEKIQQPILCNTT